MPHSGSDHLARVTPVEPGTPRVLSKTWVLFSNLVIISIPLLILVAMLGLSRFLAILVGGSPGYFLFCALVTSIAAQTVWAATFPEWPVNRLLRWRLSRCLRKRQAVGDRSSDPLFGFDRMVEWVPRESWDVARLESASDIALIKVDETGVEMIGDQYRYQFPASSLIDVALQSIRPSGCFHKMHFVILTVRSEDGPMEYPISYRDHWIGRLRNRSREEEANVLLERIQSIVKEGDFTFPLGVTSPEAGLSPQRPKVLSENPYAAPRTT